MHRLRQALATDLPEMWEVRYSVAENTLTPGRLSDEDVRRSIEDTGRGWVIEDDGHIAAFAVGNAETGNVWALFVRPAAQGRGFGSMLHDAMIEWFRTQPIETLWLSTGTDTRARAFYEKNGWTCVGPYGADEVRYERINTAEPGLPMQFVRCTFDRHAAQILEVLNDAIVNSTALFDYRAADTGFDGALVPDED